MFLAIKEKRVTLDRTSLQSLVSYLGGIIEGLHVWRIGVVDSCPSVRERIILDDCNPCYIWGVVTIGGKRRDDFHSPEGQLQEDTSHGSGIRKEVARDTSRSQGTRVRAGPTTFG